MIQELDPSPFLMSSAKFCPSRNSSFVSTKTRALLPFGSSRGDLVPAGSVVPAYVLRRAGLLDRVSGSLTHYRE